MLPVTQPRRVLQRAYRILCQALLLRCLPPGFRRCLGSTVFAATCAFAIAQAPHVASAGTRTALDEYIEAADTNYTFSLVRTLPGTHFTAYVLELTSQAWLTTNEVDRPIWKHWLTIVKPEEVRSNKGLLFIAGGSNRPGAPSKADDKLTQIALATKSVVSELKMVPNQPLFFADGVERTEDSLIAYTWDKFLRTGDSKWPARLPMTKSAVRALDAITAFCATQTTGGLHLDGFVVSGGSKRGWTTWTTAAVDKRVIGIIPAVIDVLNVAPSMRHHFGAYGFWAPAIDDYSAFQIMEWNGTPQFSALMQIEDPYSYRDRLTMPKVLVNAAGDQFFLPDSSQFYFDALKGPKYLRYIPNADHSLKDSDALETLLASYNAMITGSPLPEFTWKIRNKSIEVSAKDKPTEVKLWQATNPNARDFRLETLGPVWTAATVTESGTGRFTAKLSKPAKGWTAYFVELTFPSTSKVPFKFTTQVKVVPDKLPFRFKPKGPPPRVGAGR